MVCRLMAQTWSSRATSSVPILRGRSRLETTRASRFPNNNLLGGTTVAARNVISGNRNRGVGIGGNFSGNMVQGNYIGVDVTGTAALGNGNEGVAIFSSNPHDNVVGGITSVPGTPPGNIIS